MRKKCIQCCNNFSIRAVPLGLDHTKNNSNVSVCCEVGTEICYILLHSLLWVIPRRLECYVPTFRNNLFHPHRWVKQEVHEDGTEWSETSVHKIQTSGNHPKQRTRHSEDGERLFCLYEFQDSDI